jgi:hypothetical protein
MLLVCSFDFRRSFIAEMYVTYHLIVRVAPSICFMHLFAVPSLVLYDTYTFCNLNLTPGRVILYIKFWSVHRGTMGCFKLI